MERGKRKGRNKRKEEGKPQRHPLSDESLAKRVVCQGGTALNKRCAKEAQGMLGLRLRSLHAQHRCE